MPKYAILGATGATGQAILDILSESPKYQVNAYVRSKSKLERLRPGIGTRDNVHIFGGDLHDVSLIARCISGTSAAFAVVGVNANTPNTTIAQDTAHVLVAALCRIRTEDSAAKLPRIVVLSSATINARLCRDTPRPVLWLLESANYHVYRDLRLAESYLRLHKSWLNVTFIQPGGLVQDVRKGHVLSVERQKTFLSYPDLAAGMVEVADTEGKYDWMGVSVLPTGKDVKRKWRLPFLIPIALLLTYLPWMYPLLKSVGAV